MIWGPVYYRYPFGFARGAPIERDFVERLVDNVLASIGTV
jgi:hypothetical protein